MAHAAELGLDLAVWPIQDESTGLDDPEVTRRCVISVLRSTATGFVHGEPTLATRSRGPARGNLSYVAEAALRSRLVDRETVKQAGAAGADEILLAAAARAVGCIP